MNRKYTTLPFTKYPVADGHYDETRAPISLIVLHSSASTRQGLIDTFAGGTRMVSAHYGIDNDGSILAFLEEYFTAYHAGNYAVNQRSIGLEHIDQSSTIKLHTDKQYETSIKLVADICKFYNLPCNSTTVVPHSVVSATACPNGLDVNRIINGANALLGGTPPIGDALSQCLSQHTVLVTELDALKKTLSDKATIIEGLNTQITKLLSDNKILADKLAHIPPCPPQTDCNQYISQITYVKSTLWGKGFWWTKINNLKAMFPK